MRNAQRQAAPVSNEMRSIRMVQRRMINKHLRALHAMKEEGFAIDVMLEIAFGDMETRRDLMARPDEKQAIKELYEDVLNGR